MAFSSRRGRPPRPVASSTDYGTPELQLKHALGVTREPIDLCLERKLVTPDQHWCSLHLRWLYTLRYGAPSLTTRYADKDSQTAPEEDNSQWRTLREREYHAAAACLQQSGYYDPVMRVSVFNELPAFLNPALMRRAWAEPALAQRLQRSHGVLLQGLDVLVQEWRPAKEKFSSSSKDVRI